jgi:hypothetical protein
MVYHRYRFADLGFESELALPELGPEVSDGIAADVSIKAGPVRSPDGGPPPPGTIAWSGAPARCLLEVPGVARFEVRDRRYVTFERTAAHGDALLRLYLLGSVFGALWHQLGRLPLHAGALDIGGRAWAFVGASGAGKSSLVVALAASGAGYLCDDVCVLDVPAHGAVRAWPGLARLRVSPQICTLLGLDDQQEGSLDPFGKRSLVPPWTRPQGARSLAGVLTLEVDPSVLRPALERLAPPAALAAILAHTYRREYLPAARQAAHLAQCVALVRQVPVYRLRRPWGIERLQADTQRIADLLASLPPGAA